jgi:RHS repeat-associated protein
MGGTKDSMSFTYDPQGRLVSRTYEGGQDVFAYRPNGLLWTATNQNIAYTLTYYANGWLQLVTDSNGRVVEYSYNGAGQKTLVSLPQTVINYGYDSAEKLQTINGPAGTFTYGYDALGRRQSLSYPNGITADYSYKSDQPGWLAGITYTQQNPVYSLSYPSFDMVGNRAQKTEDGATIGYEYDGVYRVLNTDAGEVYTYDPAGNRATENGQGYTYNAGNQLTATQTTTFTYGTVGNVTGKNDWVFGWNGVGQLTSASRPGTTVGFQYDPFGRRVGKTVNGVVHQYVYDGANVVLEYVDGVLVNQFVHGPSIDEHLAVIQNGTPYFYLIDGLGSVARITDGNGSIVQSYSYSAFGKVTASNPDFIQPYSFTGREYDPETGLLYYRARYMDPEIGRFISRDPIGFAGGDVILWGYVGNNPVNWVDPEGLEIGGEQYGEVATLYWASLAIKPTNAWYQTAFYTTAGLFASLWTPSTSEATFAVLSAGLGVSHHLGRPYYQYYPEGNPGYSSKYITRGWGWGPPCSVGKDAVAKLALPPWNPGTAVRQVKPCPWRYIKGPGPVKPNYGQRGGGWEYRK